MKDGSAITKEELVKQFRTEAILAATRKVIADDGLEGLTLEKVAEAAGISKGTIYLYFKNRRDLIVNIVQGMIDDDIRELEMIAGADEDAITKLKNLVRFPILINSEQRDIFRLIAGEMNIFRLEPDSEGMRQLRDVRENFLRLISGVLEEGLAAGLFRKLDVDAAAETLLMIIDGCRLSQVLLPPRRSPEEQAERIGEFFIQGIRK